MTKKTPVGYVRRATHIGRTVLVKVQYKIITINIYINIHIHSCTDVYAAFIVPVLELYIILYYVVYCITF